MGAVQAQSLGQLQPAFDAAPGADIAAMIFNAMPPFEANAAVAEPRDHHRILDRYRALVIIAVQRPGLHLALVQLAAMQQPMKRMQVVIARRADLAQRRFQVLGAFKPHGSGERKGCGRVQGLISVPSAGICQPAPSAMARSLESCSKTRLELLICKKILRSMPRSASAAIAPFSPDIAICPMPCPVLLPRPNPIIS